VAQNNSEVSRAPFAETHSAVVYFARDRAYKLVNLGFLDFTTRQARAAACARVTELNRRYAPDVYLGVAGWPGSSWLDASRAKRGPSCSPTRRSHGGRGPRAGHALP
jgi:hypothetical protein